MPDLRAAHGLNLERVRAVALINGVVEDHAAERIGDRLVHTGGVTAGRRVTALASAYDRPIAPHDCTGPVVLCANTHLMMASANSLIVETVRASYNGFYRDVLTVLPRIEGGYAYPMTGAGLGTALRPEIVARTDARVRRTATG